MSTPNTLYTHKSHIATTYHLLIIIITTMFFPFLPIEIPEFLKPADTAHWSYNNTEEHVHMLDAYSDTVVHALQYTIRCAWLMSLQAT